MTDNIILHEVGPRDGIQVEKKIVPTETKIQWIQKLWESGITTIQIGSFVRADKVPSMGDTPELFQQLQAIKPDNVCLSALVLNDKGVDLALESNADMICIGVSASETHSLKNSGKSTSEALARNIQSAKKAVEAGKKVQVSIQSAFGCGFEGPIDPEKVLNIAKEYINAGLYNISLADTAGHANPLQVEQLYTKLQALDPKIQMACHFHNTYGLGLANCYAAWKAGVQSFETSFAGLGGCPFTKVPSGNVCTEDFVHSFQRMNYLTHIQLSSLIELANNIATFFERELPGMIYRTGPIQPSASKS